MGFNDHWKPPKDAARYFTPEELEEEKSAKEKYGIFYYVYMIFTIIALIVPFLVFMSLIPDNVLNPATELADTYSAISATVGMIGSFMIGFGITNILSIFVKQYLGHWVTIITIGLGTIIDVIVLYLMKFI